MGVMLGSLAAARNLGAGVSQDLLVCPIASKAVEGGAARQLGPLRSSVCVKAA